MHNQQDVLTRVVKEKGTGKILGTFPLIPPEGIKNRLSVYTKIELFSFIVKVGLDPVIRMLRLDSYNKSILQESMKNSGYYYLSMVVIREEYRGTGIGTAVLRQAIQELISSDPAFGTLGLTTQLPENVIFYSRLGFEKLDEGFVEFKGDTYYNYNMKFTLASKR